MRFACGFPHRPSRWVLVAGLLAVAAARAQEPENRRLLFQARTALQDALAPMAERLAREAYAHPDATPEDRLEALDTALAAIEAQGDAQRLLAVATGPGLGAPAIPTHGRPTLWQARALLRLGRPTEAVALLQNPPSEADAATAAALGLLLPPALLAAGDTNAALTAYSRIAGWPEESAGQDAARLEHARLLLALGREEDAIGQLAPWVDQTTSRSPAADAARLLLAQRLLAGPEAQKAVDVVRPLLDAASTPPDVRATALLDLAAAATLRDDAAAALSSAEQAVAAADSAPTRFAAHATLVRLLCRSPQPERALPILREAIRATPRAPEAALLQLDVAEALHRQQQHAAALLEAQSVIEAQTDPAIEARAQRVRGEAFAATGRFDEAALALLRAADLDTDPERRADSLFRAAECLRSADLHPQAVEALLRFQTQFPTSSLAPRAALLQGESLAQTAPADAEEHLLGAAARYPAEPEGAHALFLAARLAAARNDSPSAIRRYTDAAAHAAATPELQSACRVGRGLLHFQAFHFDLALGDFEPVAAQGEETIHDQARYLRTATLYNLGLEKESLAAATEFLDTRPDSVWAPDVTYWLGRYFFNRQDYAKATAYFQRFTENWPTRPECDGALLWLARSHFALRRYPEASTTALSITKEHPRSPLVPEARFLHGEALCELMRFDEAILVFDELLVLHPDSPWTAQALGRKGDALFTLGTDDQSRYTESIAAYGALLARPGLPLDSQLQAAYKIGRCHEKLGRTDQALDLYYRGGVLRFLEAREAGLWLNERARAWFTRAALSAADLFEHQEQWSSAVAVLQRLAGEDVQGREEASERARRLLQAHPIADPPVPTNRPPP